MIGRRERRSDLANRPSPQVDSIVPGTAYTRRMSPYVVWFVAALGLLVLELASTTFFAIFLAIGAFAAGLLAFFVPGSPIWVQAVVALAVAGAGVVVGRPFLSSRLSSHTQPPLTPGVHGGFVGQRALALDEIGDELHPGHVRLAGETWLAFSTSHEPIATGAPVIVTAVRGTTMVVAPATQPVAAET